MADFTLSRYFAVTALSFIALFSGFSLSDDSSLFSFPNFGKDVSFDSAIAMYGDAKVVDGGSSIQMTDSVSYSSGRVVYRKPIKLVGNDPEYPFPASFSTFFSLSMSRDSGSCLGFAVFPALSGNNGTIRSSSLFQVEFDTSANVSKYGDSNENHVAVLVDGSVMEKISNFTSADLVMNSEEKLYAWIDYQSDSKRLEIRFRNSGDAKPSETLISCWIDLSAMAKDDEFMVGVYSYNRNSTQTYNLHSWSFQVRRIPRWMHSNALVDPNNRSKPADGSDKKRKDMALQILTCFITTFGSMAFLSFALVYLWTFFRRNSLVMVVPEECGINNKGKEFEYKKMEKVGEAETQEPK